MRFKRGGYLASNYVTAAQGQSAVANTMEEIACYGLQVFHQNGQALAEPLAGLTIAANSIALAAGDCPELSRIGVAVSPRLSVTGVTITGNEFTGAAPSGDLQSIGVWVSAEQKTSVDVLVANNNFADLTHAVYLQGQGGEQVVVTDNVILDGRDFSLGLSSGVRTSGALDTVSIIGNEVSSTTGSMSYGLLLAGTVNKIIYGLNYFSGLTAANINKAGLVATQETDLDSL